MGWGLFGSLAAFGQGRRFTGVVLLAASAAYHAWVAQRMQRGWRPGFVVRYLPACVVLAVVLVGIETGSRAD